MTGQTAVGLLSYGARVVDQEPGFFGRGHPGQTQLFEQSRDALGVMIVHLAPERAQIIVSGRPKLTIPVTLRSRDPTGPVPLLLGVLHSPAFADDRDPDGAGVVEFLFDLLGDLAT